MERKLAILVADLAGYTALTEAHGSFSAAQIVDKYLQIVNNSLTGSSRLVERVGDEVVIIAEIARDLVETALRLRQLANEENNFLAIHAGIHIGDLLERNGSFFGTAINLASRIASISKGGQILCSASIIKEVAEASNIEFTCLGEVSFKNLRTKIELFEIKAEPHLLPPHIDPVCRMLVLPNQAIHCQHEGKMYYFCSGECQTLFVSSPKDFASAHEDETIGS
ncbi:adenylate/guanylate cyclase domain-containing protein [Rhodocytophaga aerolata]|uniref:Adenylate/guanylate cyclase domain-containing protein n=1 Tax=Rhodocytophaga aerolata TaxID=455078 RepID=A0ABT8REQ5_9BACT|nr:YHS domain-containing protein [Rhodocytophaga aerolata]MDO1449202.1 adenylate/guanylate cyclase domain-containing protein [Rhodocytophaga aerolata]